MDKFDKNEITEILTSFYSLNKSCIGMDLKKQETYLNISEIPLFLQKFSDKELSKMWSEILDKFSSYRNFKNKIEEYILSKDKSISEQAFKEEFHLMFCSLSDQKNKSNESKLKEIENCNSNLMAKKDYLKEKREDKNASKIKSKTIKYNMEYSLHRDFNNFKLNELILNYSTKCLNSSLNKMNKDLFIEHLNSSNENNIVSNILKFYNLVLKNSIEDSTLKIPVDHEKVKYETKGRFLIKLIEKIKDIQIKYNFNNDEISEKLAFFHCNVDDLLENLSKNESQVKQWPKEDIEIFQNYYKESKNNQHLEFNELIEKYGQNEISKRIEIYNEILK